MCVLLINIILHPNVQGQKPSSEIAESLLNHWVLLKRDRNSFLSFNCLAELTSVPDSMKVVVVVFHTTDVSFFVVVPRMKYVKS